jgi:hypothetical protein
MAEVVETLAKSNWLHGRSSKISIILQLMNEAYYYLTKRKVCQLKMDSENDEKSHVKKNKQKVTGLGSIACIMLLTGKFL